jgi:hypothetical protein
MRDFEDANTSGDLADYSQAVRAEVRRHWAPYLQREVFGPSGIQAACADVAASGSNYARAYADISDRTRGRLSTPQNTATCTTGGMVMSVSDMTKLLHALSCTDRIISNALFREEMTRADDRRVGFDSRIRLCGRLDALASAQCFWGKRKASSESDRQRSSSTCCPLSSPLAQNTINCWVIQLLRAQRPVHRREPQEKEAGIRVRAR